MLFATLLTVILIVPSLGTTDGVVQDKQWSIDRSEVNVGGSVTIVVNLASREVSKLMLHVDDRESVRLVDAAGPAAHHREQTLVLISHDIFHAEISQAADGATTMVHIPPIFARPGKVRLELEADGISWGVKTVEVVAAPANAQRAIDLLYPTVVRGDKSGADSARLMHLLVNGSFGEGAGVDERAELEKVREVLPDLRKHPDWAEIFDALVARLDAQNYRRSVTTRNDDPPYRIKDDIDELPVVPETVTRALDRELKSPFAQAIQENIRGLMNDVDRLDHARRAERHP